MSEIRVDNVKNEAGTGAPTFPNGAIIVGNVGSTSLNVSGISTLGNTVVGGATTQVVINGNLRVTGIITTGTSSITIDPINDQIKVGTAATISITGFNVGSSNLHSTGLDLGTGNVTSHNINSTGIITASQFRVGTAVTVNSSGVTVTGVITATSFSGDGTNLTNTGSTLSAASGSQRVVLTGQTSGTMTASATSASLTFNASTGTLSATSFSGALTGNVTGNVTGNATGLSGTPNITVGTVTGNLTGNINSTGVSTVSTLKYSYETKPIITPANTSYTIYISDSGNDTTGNGTSGSPYRSLQKALDLTPRILIAQPVDIRILGASYTSPSSSVLNGLAGSGWHSYYGGDGITIRADTGTITFNTNNYGIEFTDVPYPIRFRNINFVIPNNGNYNGMYFYNCDHTYVYDTCTWTTGSTYAWSWGGGVRVTLCTNFQWYAGVTVNSSSSPGLGGLFIFDRCNSVSWGGNMSKSGTKWGQAALVAVNNTWIEQTGTINNFETAIRLGINHYSAEDGAQCLLGNTQLTNCTYGVDAYYSSSLRAYYVTSTAGTGTAYRMNSGSHQH